MFTPEKYSLLENIHYWKIFTPEKYSAPIMHKILSLSSNKQTKSENRASQPFDTRTAGLLTFAIRSATWICLPCLWVGEVAWLRGGRWKRRTRMVIEGTLRGPPGPKNSKNIINVDIKRYYFEYLLFWIILEKCLKCAMVEAVGGSSLPYYEARML